MLLLLLTSLGATSLMLLLPLLTGLGTTSLMLLLLTRSLSEVIESTNTYNQKRFAQNVTYFVRAIKRYNQQHSPLPPIFLSRVEEFKRSNLETVHDDVVAFGIVRTLVTF